MDFLDGHRAGRAGYDCGRFAVTKDSATQWQITIALVLVSIAASVIVVLWTTTIQTLKEHEHRITKLEEKLKVLDK